MKDSTCSVEACTKGGKIVKGMCLMHYERMRRYGSLDEPHLAKAWDRFWSKVNKTETCWLWTASKNAYGYGTFGIGRKETWLVHRYAWTHLVGPIPDGMELDHVCHVHNCLNPKHLRTVTSKQNHENMSGAFVNSKTGIRGVSWDKSKRLWRATVGHNYKQIHVGRYRTIEEAEAAVIAKRNELFTHNHLDRIAA